MELIIKIWQFGNFLFGKFGSFLFPWEILCVGWIHIFQVKFLRNFAPKKHTHWIVKTHVFFMHFFKEFNFFLMLPRTLTYLEFFLFHKSLSLSLQSSSWWRHCNHLYTDTWGFCRSWYNAFYVSSYAWNWLSHIDLLRPKIQPMRRKKLRNININEQNAKPYSIWHLGFPRKFCFLTTILGTHMEENFNWYNDKHDPSFHWNSQMKICLKLHLYQ